jgi:hypothetical protein
VIHLKATAKISRSKDIRLEKGIDVLEDVCFSSVIFLFVLGF